VACCILSARPCLRNLFPAHFVFLQPSDLPREIRRSDSASQALFAPFAPQQFGTTQTLQSISDSLSLSHSFGYSASGTGELTQVTFPYSGRLRWEYQSFTFSGNKTVREVQNRYLLASSGGTEELYAFDRNPADTAKPLRSWTRLTGPASTGRKVWSFSSGTGTFREGLISSLAEQNSTGVALRQQDYTWVQDVAQTPYISEVLTTLDPGTSNQKQMKVSQIVDSRGNVTESKVYDYGSLSTPARTYTNTYSTASAYYERYIYNRLLTSTVTDGSQTVTLVTNTYDTYSGGALTNVSGLRQHDTANYYSTFTTRGNVTTQQTPGKTINHQYDITGTVASSNDGYGHTLSITQASGTNHAAPGVVTPNGDSNLATTSTYTPFLAVASVTAPNASTESITYDSYGRPQTRTSPDGASTSYTYTYNPTTVKATTNGKWEKTTQDGLGRTVRVEKGDASGATLSTVDTEYSACACSPLGKVKRVSQPYAPGGTVYWTTYTYDALGRTLSVTLPGGTGTTGYAYQGNRTTVTDPAGKWKKYTSNAMGNLVQVTEPNPAGGTDLET